jgi:hypothetical protein
MLVAGRLRLLPVFGRISLFSGFLWFIRFCRPGLFSRAIFPRVIFSLSVVKALPLFFLLRGGRSPASFPVQLSS